MGQLLESRRASNRDRLTRLCRDLEQAEALAGSKACIYVTGSFGRGEAGSNSDLDLFIVGKGAKDSRELSRLDEICIKADLIEASRQHSFPEFSGDGEYLVHHTIGDLVATLGGREDDASNTFTARLLLLLESRPLLCEQVYKDLIDDVIATYWRDYEDHKSAFMPAFLANDILRLWRTFCVNYEARTQTEPAEKKAKRKLKNYKLKHSRLLTCYSALVYLLFVHRKQGTVHPADVFRMVQLSPTERLEWIRREEGSPECRPHVDAVLDLYEAFLADTDRTEAQLVAEFLDRERARSYMHRAGELGNKVFELLASLGRSSPFFRLLVV